MSRDLNNHLGDAMTSKRFASDKGLAFNSSKEVAAASEAQEDCGNEQGASSAVDGAEKLY